MNAFCNQLYTDKHQSTWETLFDNNINDDVSKVRNPEARKSATSQTNGTMRVFKTFIRSHSIAVEIPKVNYHNTSRGGDKVHGSTRKGAQTRRNRHCNKSTTEHNIRHTISTHYDMYTSDITDDSEASRSGWEMGTINMPPVKIKQVKAAHRQNNADQKRYRHTNALNSNDREDDFENKCFEIEDLYARCMRIRSTKSVK
ncbi:hypothetical protein BGZ76_000510 [Entomortierella beljakovae]|nr:hypothetical protein BGZ76_000510 [Entomortierella beljakovae]